ncbi:hypothetical protein CsSME_00029225 [Camellia sinensis var. sinensis]
MQKNHVAHKRVLELCKTTRQAVAEANSKTTELNEAKQKMTELESEVARLTEMVSSAKANKQKTLAERKDKYLRELVKLEKKKDAEIAEVKKSAKDAEDHGYKDGEATYILQCEAAKDIFFKCGWKAANPPPHFIPSYMADYANAIQEKLLQVGEEDEASLEPEDAPAATINPGLQTTQSARVDPPVPITVDDVAVTDLPANTGLPSGEAQVDLDADLDDLFA